MVYVSRPANVREAAGRLLFPAVRFAWSGDACVFQLFVGFVCEVYELWIYVKVLYM